MMPDMSGYDVCREIRADAATALLPVVMVTALDATQERAKGLDAGADDFLSKPINRSELMARVNSLFRIKTYQDQLADPTGSHVRLGFEFFSTTQPRSPVYPRRHQSPPRVRFAAGQSSRTR